MGIPQEKTVMGIPQEKTVMGIPQEKTVDSPNYSSSEEARDELRRIGEGESPEANRRRWPVRSLKANRLRERSSEMPRS